MPVPSRAARAATLACVACLTSSVASAQQVHPLAAPTIAASAAAAADWMSTYHALRNYRVRETNPLLQPWQSEPARLVSVGAVVDAGAVSTWNLAIGRAHPTVASAGLWGMAAFRTYLAIHNWRNERTATKITKKE